MTPSTHRKLLHARPHSDEAVVTPGQQNLAVGEAMGLPADSNPYADPRRETPEREPEMQSYSVSSLCR